MATFTFTIRLKEGKQYQYEGTIESLSRHLKANQHLEPTVIEDMTRFSDDV
jgi:hypothetical protein